MRNGGEKRERRGRGVREGERREGGREGEGEGRKREDKSRE